MTRIATSKTGVHGQYIGTTKVAPPSTEPGSPSARFFNGTSDRMVGMQSNVLGQDYLIGMTFWRASAAVTPNDNVSQRLFTQYSNAPNDTVIGVGINRGMLSVIAEFRGAFSSIVPLTLIETHVAILDTNKHKVALWVRNNEATPREYVLYLDGKEVWHFRPQYSQASANLPILSTSQPNICIGADYDSRFFHGYIDDIFIFKTLPYAHVSNPVPYSPGNWLRYLTEVGLGQPYRSFLPTPFSTYAEGLIAPYLTEIDLTGSEGYQLRALEGQDYPNARAAVGTPFSPSTVFPVQTLEFKFTPGLTPQQSQLSVGYTRAPNTTFLTSALGLDADSYAYFPDGTFRGNNSSLATGLATWTFSDALALRWDSSNGSITFLKNGTAIHTYTPPTAPWYGAVRYGNNTVYANSGKFYPFSLPLNTVGVYKSVESRMNTEFRFLKCAAVLAPLNDAGTTIVNAVDGQGVGTYTAPVTSNANTTGDPYDTSRRTGTSIIFTSAPYTAAGTGFFFGVAFSPEAADLTGTKYLMECVGKWSIRLVSGTLRATVGGLEVTAPSGGLVAGGKYLATILRLASGKLQLQLSGGGVGQSLTATAPQTAAAVYVGSDATLGQKFTGTLSHVILNNASPANYELARLAAAGSWNQPTYVAVTGEFTVTNGTFTGALQIFGGTGPYTVSVSAGTPPPGVSFSVSGNTIIASGTATAEGAYNWTLTAQDSLGATGHIIIDMPNLLLFWGPSALSVPIQLYADETTAVTDVSGVASQWNDKSGNNLHFTQSTAGNRPTILATTLNGGRALWFDGTTEAMFSGTAAARNIGRNTPAIWTFVIFRDTQTPLTGFDHTLLLISDSNNNARYAIGRMTGSVGILYTLNARRLPADSAGTLQGQANPSSSWSMRFDSVNFTTGQGIVAVNGTVLGTGAAVSNPGGNTADTAANRSLTLAGIPMSTVTNPGTAQNSPVEIGAVIIGQGALPSPAEMDKLFGWGAHKYNLTAVLPAGHPYKVNPPTI